MYFIYLYLTRYLFDFDNSMNLSIYSEDKNNEIKNTKPFDYTVTLFSQQKPRGWIENGHLMLFVSKTEAQVVLSNPDREWRWMWQVMGEGTLMEQVRNDVLFSED